MLINESFFNLLGLCWSHQNLELEVICDSVSKWREFGQTSRTAQIIKIFWWRQNHSEAIRSGKYQNWNYLHNNQCHINSGIPGDLEIQKMKYT